MSDSSSVDTNKPVVLAGAGLLRWGTTLSVNPLQRLKKLVVAEKIIIPEPTEATDACTKNYVDTVVSAAEQISTVKVDAGLVVSDEGSILLAKNLEVETIRLSGLANDQNNAIPKSYVDHAVQSLATKSYTDELVKDHITLTDIKPLIEPLASRVYVDSKVATFIDRPGVNEILKDYVTKDVLRGATENLASISFVNNALTGTVHSSILDEKLANVANKQYVDQNIQDLVNKSSLANAIEPLATSQTVNEKLDEIKNDMATQSWVTENIERYAEKAYVDTSVAGLASRVYVEQLIGPLAEENYVDAAVENLASKAYVDNAVTGLARKPYVDEQIKYQIDSSKYNAGVGLVIKSADDGKPELVTTKDQSHVTKVGSLDSLTISGKITYSVQYVVPNNGEVVNANGRTYLLLNPTGTIDGITINLPLNPVDGQYFTISTSHDLSNVVLGNYTSSGAILVPDNFTLTAGSFINFIYSSDAGTWFNV